MAVYSNLKIRNKLLVGYSIMVAVSLLIGYFGIMGMAAIRLKLDDLHDNLLPSVALTGMMERQSQQHRRLLVLHLLAPDPQSKEELHDLLKHEERDFNVTLKKFNALPLQSRERQILEEESRAWADYLAASVRVIELDDQGDRDRALDLEHRVLSPLFNQIETSSKRLAQLNLEEADQHHGQSHEVFTRLRVWMTGMILVAVCLALAIALFITRSVVGPIQIILDALSHLVAGGQEKARLTEAIAAGDLQQDIKTSAPLPVDLRQAGTDETGVLLKAIAAMNEVQSSFDQSFVRMTEALRRNRDIETRRDWFKTGQNELNTLLRGDRKTEELTDRCLAFLAEYLGAGVGVFYLFNSSAQCLEIMATYAYSRRKGLLEKIALGQGLAGQAARERKLICLSQAPPDYLTISSALGEAKPWNIVALPLLHNDQLVGILELGSFAAFSDADFDFLHQATEALAIGISVNQSRQLVNELLEQTQQQAEELRVQQEELQQSNEELEERAQMLENQRQEILTKNRALEETSLALQHKAAELERVSTYKSEFLANMSHELRTPLNSLLILSGLLKDNKDGNLTDKQLQFAATINGAGRDLLNLINDILDLSKIESGHLEFHYEEVLLAELFEELKGTCQPLAAEKALAFSTSAEASAPSTLFTDRQRLQQIVKNLIANACKFTEQGSVSVRVYTPEASDNPLPVPAMALAVRDTGIGIPADKQELIFNAFQQADGTTSRKYGGTGLGLSISRQLARSMRGEITVASTPGQGSVFTLFLPRDTNWAIASRPQAKAAAQGGAMTATPPLPQPQATDTMPGNGAELPPAPLPDDREQVRGDDKSILIIEDDMTFAAILLDMVRGRGFKGLVAADGEGGIVLAERLQPSAVILDVMLPHINGWGVMRSLKDNPATRHIPVHFITCLDERQKAMNMGAIGFVRKPVDARQLDQVFSTIEQAIDKPMKRLLIVEDNVAEASSLVALLAARDVEISVAASGAEAIARLEGNSAVDCIVLDLGLADMAAFDLLEHIQQLDPKRRLPVIIHTGQDLSHDSELRLRHYAESIIIKGAKSPERLLNEVSLFLHLVESSLPADKQRMIRHALDKEAMLEGKKVLIVDDDMRNTFSLSSALTDKGMVVAEAENGRVALAYLKAHPEVDLIIMDIMMPEMDGYETIRAIRQDDRFTTVPIIALTAKAMVEDRQHCLTVGASDYISKPVDMDKLFSLLRVWLYQAE